MLIRPGVIDIQLGKGSGLTLRIIHLNKITHFLYLFVWAVYKKHYPPALGDEVWRLDKIGKDGAFHKRLNQSGIQTVEDFLRLVVMDPQRLRNVFSTTLLLAVLLVIVCVPLFCIVQNGRIV
jgi:hypothetical protein